MKTKHFKFDLKIYLIFFISAIILVLHSFYFYPFLSDDSLISLQYAKRFLQGKGLTWTEGIPVEGYTNLLWILLISLLGLFKVDLIFATRFLGIVLNVFVLFILIKTAEKINKDKKISIISIIIATLFYSFSGIIAAWAIGGLEQPLLNFLFAASFYYTIDLFNKSNVNLKETIRPGIFLGLMCLTRMDGILFVFCFWIIFLFKKITKKNIILSIGFILPAVILLLGQLIFRIFYYNDIIPNTAYIKLIINKISIQTGFNYVINGFKLMIPVLFFILFIFYNKKKVKIISLLLMSLIIWLLYIIGIGGDIFPANRHFNIIVVIFSFLILLSLNNFFTKYDIKKVFKYFVYLFLFILLIFYFKGQFADKMIKKAKAEKWEWDGKEIALMLKNGFKDNKPLVVTSSAGSIPYWSDLPVVDSLGLNDYYIPRYSERNILDRRIGHGFGDGYYILSKFPDIIIFCGPWGSVGPCFTSEMQIFETQEFKKNYIPAIFKINTKNKKINSIMWINKNSQKIGIIRNENYIQIPAYLLDRTLRNYIYLGSDNKFKIKILNAASVFIDNLELQKNSYIIKTQPDIAGIIEIKNIVTGKILAGKLPLKFNVDYSKFEIKIIPEKKDEITSILIEKI